MLRKLSFISLFLFVSLIMNAQENYFLEEWKKIEQQFEEGEFKSLKPQVEQLLQKAKEQNSFADEYRAWIALAQINIITKDDFDASHTLYNELRQLVENAKGAEKAILASFAASTLENYYNQNRYNIASRTDLNEQNSSDFRTWTKKDFLIEIHRLYTLAREQRIPKRQMPIETWQRILLTYPDQEKIARNWRPFLADLLHYRSIPFYKVNAEEPELKEVELSQLWQHLQQMHLSEKQISAYLHAKHQGIEFAELSHEERYKALEELGKEYPLDEYQAELLFERAEMLNNYALETAEETNPKKALELLEQIERFFPNSFAAKNNVQGLKNKIKERQVNIQMENYNSPNQPILVEVSYANVHKVFYKILRVNAQKEPYTADWKERARSQKNINALLKLHKEVYAGTWDFRDFGDYKIHSTLKNLGEFPTGTYVIVFSDDSDFDAEKGKIFKYSQIAITNYALAQQDNEVLLSHRESGKPVGKTSITYRFQNYRTRNYTYNETKTNPQGIAELTWNNDYNQNVNLKVEDEEVWFDSYFRENDYYGNDFDDDIQFKIFTDRAIYRPGQTVHFKLVAYSEQGINQFKIRKGAKDVLYLEDPNGNTIQEIKFTTNEMGSYSGTISLPVNGITGEFMFELDNYELLWDNKTIRVEEYKRPKFSVSFNPPTEAFQLNDSVQINGFAKAFAGNPITDAKVTYTVNRAEYYPYRYYGYGRSSYYNSRPEQIAQGETRTDAKGGFDINFLASIPQKQRNNSKRNFQYTLNAVVTDSNGETHEQSYTLTLGEVNLILGSDLANEVYRDDWKEIELTTNDLNRNKVEAKGTISIHELPSQEQIIHTTNWKGDYVDWSPEEFYKLFPHIEYPVKDEQPKIGREVWRSNFDTQSNSKIKIPNLVKGLKRGRYLLVLESVDKGDTVRYEKDFILNDALNTVPVEKVFFDANLASSELEVGGEARIQFATSVPDALVYVQFSNEKGEQWTKTVQLSDEIQSIKIPLSTENEGYNRVDYFFHKWGESRSGSIPFSVNRKSKKLNILTQSFRDKIEPGSKEKWRFTVEDSDKQGVLAEVLATMYDASLDEFVSHDLAYSPYNDRQIYNNFWTAFRTYRSNSQWIPYFRNRKNFYAQTLRFPELATYSFSLDERYANRLRFKKDKMSDDFLAVESDGVLEEVVALGYAPPPQAVVVNGVAGSAAGIQIRGNASLAGGANPLYILDGVPISLAEFRSLNKEELDKVSILKGEQATALYGAEAANGVILITTKAQAQREKELLNVQARDNLEETAFFYPHIGTNEKGDFTIEFTAPESLTEWKFMAFAHTTDMRLASLTQTTRTQKELMVVPNPPRFLREGDEILLQAKVVNLSEKTLTPDVQLFLYNPFTEEKVDVDFANIKAIQQLELAPDASATAEWRIKIPQGFGAVKYTIVAQSGSYSDGESSVLPILTNRMLVAESLAMQAKGGETNTYTFDKLKNNASKTLENHSFTLEVLPNPIWHAIFALPYLQEFPHECSEQLFSRIFGNAVASHLLNQNPRVKAVFDDWNRKDQLTSPLERNEELKNILLTESPWVRQAQSEKEQQKRIALLFDLNNLNQNLKASLDRLEQRQSGNGGFSWFPGGEESFYVSSYILAGIGRMKRMGVSMLDLQQLTQMEQKLAHYLDSEMQAVWQDANRKKNPAKLSPSYLLQYLYARSYTHKDIRNRSLNEKEVNQLLDSLYTHRTLDGLNYQAKISLTFHRMGKTDWAKNMLNATREYAVLSKEKGMYWKENVSGWYWYQAPIETQALLIEGYDEVLNDTNAVEELKIWLLHNKKNNRWNSTKSTTSAVYALMTHGANYLEAPADDLQVWVAGEKVESTEKQQGSGYYKKTWKSQEVEPQLADIQMTKDSPGIGFAAAYWQYWEDLDNITPANSVVQMQKELFVKKNLDSGQELVAITENTPIAVGDRVVVRLQIKADRDMEFIHLKDLRASGFEPVNVLSSYKWQDGLGYYESTKDAATHFFIEYMPKGVYVFEYELVANNAGNFSNGITQFMSMYAPELSAHSKGIRVQIER